MNYSIHRISLDIHKVGSQAVLNVKKGDTARSICITLMENGKPYEIFENCSAVFSAKKPDGNYILNDCIIQDNKLVYNFTPQTAIVAGAMECEVSLYDESGNQITSPRFLIVVDEIVYNGEEIVSSSEANVLKELVEEASEVTARAEEAVALAVEATEGADRSAKLATDAADNANKAAASASEVKEEMEDLQTSVTNIHDITNGMSTEISNLNAGVSSANSKADNAVNAVNSFVEEYGPQMDNFATETFVTDKIAEAQLSVSPGSLQRVVLFYDGTNIRLVDESQTVQTYESILSFSSNNAVSNVTLLRGQYIYHPLGLDLKNNIIFGRSYKDTDGRTVVSTIGISSENVVFCEDTYNVGVTTPDFGEIFGAYSGEKANSATAYGAHAEGGQTSASGSTSHAEGWTTQASGDNSHAEGELTVASALDSHAEGKSTTASGDRSHAEGLSTIASGYSSHSEGEYSVASGLVSHAEGYETSAIGDNSHSEGLSTKASGPQSHAEGASTVASGKTSHAEGYATFAIGTASHAEGYDTQVTGRASHVSGIGTRAEQVGQFVCGKYNDNKEDTLFEIGNGTSYNDKRNAFEVYADGSLGLRGTTEILKFTPQMIDELDEAVNMASTVLEEVGKVGDLATAFYFANEVLTDTLLIYVETVENETHFKSYIVNSSTTNVPVEDSTFRGIRHPINILRHSADNIDYVVKITELTPVLGRQWINYYSTDSGSWHGWTEV